MTKQKLDPRTKNLVGQTFGSWQVLDFAGYVKRNATWMCRCVCGTEKPVKAQYLMDGRSKSCFSCSNKPAQWAGDIAPLRWHVITSNAKKRNIPFEITKEQALLLMAKQEGRCALSGVSISLPLTNTGDWTASLDRIDSSKGYTVENIQWLHKTVNLMKNVLSVDEFIKWCQLVASHRDAALH